MRTRDVDMTASARAVRARRKRVNNEAGDPGTRQKGVGSHARDVEVGSESGLIPIGEVHSAEAPRDKRRTRTGTIREGGVGSTGHPNGKHRRAGKQLRITDRKSRMKTGDRLLRTGKKKNRGKKKKKKPRPAVIRQPRDRENNFISPEAGVLCSP